jgi:hypothetical protein
MSHIKFHQNTYSTSHIETCGWMVTERKLVLVNDSEEPFAG